MPHAKRKADGDAMTNGHLKRSKPRTPETKAKRIKAGTQDVEPADANDEDAFEGFANENILEDGGVTLHDASSKPHTVAPGAEHTNCKR